MEPNDEIQKTGDSLSYPKLTDISQIEHIGGPQNTIERRNSGKVNGNDEEGGR
jgi:hypothetical protein